ncbi:MAG: C25 family cysteine peptidase, partial [candidate division WOR-3 bacterium]|nr:C25 family cysteine peptidase [candidate division WOR-3 bacterium]
MRKITYFILGLFIASSLFALKSEVITYRDNWGRYPLFNVVQSTPFGVEVIFSIHQLVVEEQVIDGVSMKSFGIPGIFLFNDAGAPNLAGTGRFIAIPQGAKAQVSIIDYRTEVYHNVDVAPAPKLPVETDDSPLQYKKNMEIYGKNAYYPDSPVKLSEPLQIRGVDCVVLGITPFQYNPVTKELIVYKDLRVRIDFIGGNGRFGVDELRNIYWEPILQGQLLNYNVLPQIDFFAPERINAQDGYEYIIIVPDNPIFIAWAETIRLWRQLQGISTNVYTITQVGGNTTTAIKNFLRNAYNTWNPRPVGFLLLSDYENSGKNYGITSYRQNHPYSGTYVSDNWYADMNNDHLPDMFHGRICAQNETQLRTMVRKFLDYERTPPSDTAFYNHPLVCCGWQTERWFQLCAEVIRGFFINGLGKDPARQYNIYSGTPTVGGAWSTAQNTSVVVNYFYNLGWLPSTTNPYNSSWWNNGSTQGIINAINSGGFILQHRDHGSETGWGEPQFSNSNINSLTNVGKLIFVNSHNCLTGRFDYSSEVFAEKFHRHTYNNQAAGALGVNAASQVSYSFVNDCYAWGMYDYMWQQFMPDYPSSGTTPASALYPCAAMCYGKYFLYSSSWPYNTGDKQVTYYLFHHHGDVFMPLYSERPQNLTVVHMPTILAGATSFTVTANDSSIIALTVNGQIIGEAMGTGNPVVIPITPQVPGTNVTITVTKFNYYRYQATIPVVASSYPYVIASTTVLNDSNANGQANPGELINYGVWAKNIGVGTATGIRGRILCNDTFVTLVRDSSWFGTIAQDDSVYSNPPYQFRISRRTPNNYQINLTLRFKDVNDSTFISYKSLRVYAPIINYITAGVSGGNNNNIFNRGETVNVIVTLKNVGGATAENVTATLLTSTPGITILDNQSNYGSITPQTTISNSTDPFVACSDTTITPGTMAQFRVAVNYGYRTDTFSFSLPVEIYLEDFEVWNGNFEPMPTSGGWAWGVPTSGPGSAHSGSKL